MPRIYTGMLADGDKPMIVPNARMLGVRTPADVTVDTEPDIRPDSNGNVYPATGGMSVSPTLMHLPGHRLPRRLKQLGVPNATGNNNLRVWALGEGPFQQEQIAPDLLLRPDPAKPTAHGFVEPDRTMSMADYQAAVALAQNSWVLDENIR